MFNPFLLETLETELLALPVCPLCGALRDETGATLVKIYGKKQEIVGSRKIGSRRIKGTGKWMLEIPVLIVQERSSDENKHVDR